MAKIVFLTNFFKPDYVGIAAHTSDLADELIANGHQVYVFTALPYYPEWEIRRSYKKKLLMRERINDVEVFRNYLYVPRNNKKLTTLQRFIHEVSFILFQFVHIVINFNVIMKSDCIIVFSPFFLQGITSTIISKVFCKKVIFHVEDIQPDAAFDLKMINTKGFGKVVFCILRFLEHLFYNTSYKVSTITPGMAENIVKKIGKDNSVFLFPYWVDFAKYHIDTQSRKRFREKSFVERNSFVIGYAGNLGRKEKLEHLLKIAASSRLNKQVRFLIAGNGADRERLLRLSNKMGLKNVRFLPLFQGQDYIDFLNGVDISYISQDEYADMIFIPSKLFKTLSCGSAILCVANKDSELSKTVIKAKAGFVFGFEDLDSTVSLVNRIFSDDYQLKKMRLKASNFAKREYCKENILKNIFGSIFE